MSEFGQLLFSEDESSRISAALNEPLTDEISVRPGPRGSKLTYIEHWKAVDLSNEVFGFSGWSCFVEHLGIDYADEKNGKWFVGAYAIVRVSIKNGCCHCDVGWGQADNFSNKGDAYEKAKKSAVSDARKRALRVFGQRLGNSIYDKEHIKQVNTNKRAKVTNVAMPQKPPGCAPGFNPGKRNDQEVNRFTNSNTNVNQGSASSKNMPQQMYGLTVKQNENNSSLQNKPLQPPSAVRDTTDSANSMSVHRPQGSSMTEDDVICNAALDMATGSALEGARKEDDDLESDAICLAALEMVSGNRM